MGFYALVDNNLDGASSELVKTVRHSAHEVVSMCLNHRFDGAQIGGLVGGRGPSRI